MSRELSGEPFTKFNNDVNRRIFELVNGTDSVSDKIGGIMAIGSHLLSFILSSVVVITFARTVDPDQLIDIDGEDNTKISRFANYLRIVLPGTDPQVSELAAKALGNQDPPCLLAFCLSPGFLTNLWWWCDGGDILVVWESEITCL